MVKKNECPNFAPNEINRLKTMAEASWKAKREVGAELCEIGGKVRIGRFCTGEACSVEIKEGYYRREVYAFRKVPKMPYQA